MCRLNSILSSTGCNSLNIVAKDLRSCNEAINHSGSLSIKFQENIFRRSGSWCKVARTRKRRFTGHVTALLASLATSGGKNFQTFLLVFMNDYTYQLALMFKLTFLTHTRYTKEFLRTLGTLRLLPTLLMNIFYYIGIKRELEMS